MSSFSLHKWFFDVLLYQDTYLFFYITELRFLRFKLSRFNLHYCSDKTKTSVSEFIKLKEKNVFSFQSSTGNFYQNNNTFLINQKLKKTNIELKYANSSKTNIQQDSHFLKIEKGVIDWQPIQMKSEVEGIINLKSTYIPIANINGYIDYVHTNIFPFKNPVSELFWGRLHSSELDLTYSVAFSKHKKKFYACCICRYINENLKTDKCNLNIIQKDWSDKLNLTFPKKISLDIQFKTFKLILNIEQGKILVESGFIDEQKNIKRAFINVLKWIAKNPRGLKFLSKGEVEIRQNNSIKIIGTRLISEYVRFGKD